MLFRSSGQRTADSGQRTADSGVLGEVSGHGWRQTDEFPFCRRREMLPPVTDEPPSGHASAAPDAPVARGEFERAMRHLNLSDVELREAVLRLGARVVALTDELTRRIDRVEPEPAPPNTPAASSADTIEAAVAANFAATFAQVRASDIEAPGRVWIDSGDKYEVEPSNPPCDEVLHLCEARCCSFDFALSTVDLDEGVIRWDYGQPYRIRQRASDGYCVHHDPGARRCTVHGQRPRVCRVYDCRDDPRVWIDFARRIPAPREAAETPLAAVRCPLSAVRCPLSAVRCPLSAVRCPLSAVRCPPSAVRRPLSAVRCPLSAVRCPLSAVRRPPSAVRRLCRCGIRCCCRHHQHRSRSRSLSPDSSISSPHPPSSRQAYGERPPPRWSCRSRTRR